MMLYGCTPFNLVGSKVPTLTPSPPPATNTPTIVWFPATATPTRASLKHIANSPTPEPSIVHGEPIYTDNFSSLQNWGIGEFQDGRISQGINEISLTVSRPRGFVFSLLSGFTESDYYLEITANPTICRASDEYGLLVRVNSRQDLFRFALTCDGRARLDRLLKGQASASVPLVRSGSVPPAAPSFSRLGIWVRKNEIRCIVNGSHLFQIKDTSLQGGGVGIFTRAAGDDVVTVNFSDLIIYSLVE